MSWLVTTGRVWPSDLIEGEYPSRGQNAVNEHRNVLDLLDAGWEPFAVVPELEATKLWLKREHNTGVSRDAS